MESELRGILSPVRLPVPPLQRAGNKESIAASGWGHRRLPGMVYSGPRYANANMEAGLFAGCSIGGIFNVGRVQQFLT